MGHGLPGVLRRDREAMSIAAETPAVIATADLTVSNRPAAQGSALMGATVKKHCHLPSRVTPEHKILSVKLNDRRAICHHLGGQRHHIPGIEKLHKA
jgi:hypothetical protein